MYKKISFCFIALIFLLTCSMNSLHASSMPDPKPDQLNKASDYKKAKGTMGNVMSLYTYAPVEAEGTKSNDQFLGHDLIFPIHYSSYVTVDKVKSELSDASMAQSYKEKKVDVFGVPYNYHCYMNEKEKESQVENKGGVCMYGGVTNPQETPSKEHTINVKVITNKDDNFEFPIKTNKKNVTVQELDYKTRSFLTKEKGLYQFDGSAFETGYIKFIEKGGNSFWYDLFPPKTLVPFSGSTFLMIYKDNKQVDAETINIEVHLNTK
ncbi:exotoxin beta-grasp domain-containing protein [Staphylococcus agnetis]|uniref:Exotoxin n=2 Tax=Staphylococcus agnetis TaxID=985762 RepID=A0AAW9YRF3_9STAP|nr:exotoxin OB-fold domain-containing protein [Staphylococcus agnetis]NJI01807.1 exotoxin [Staphylococcus agnetis]